MSKYSIIYTIGGTKDMYEIKGTREFKECGKIITIECTLNDVPNEDDYNEYKGKDFLQDYVSRLCIDEGVILYNNDVIARILKGEVKYLG